MEEENTKLESSKEKKAKNSNTTIIIVLLITIMLILGVFIFVKKDVLFNSNSQSEVKSTTKEEKEETKTITLEEAKEMLDKLGLTPDSKLHSEMGVEVYTDEAGYSEIFKLANAAEQIEEDLWKAVTCSELYEGKAKINNSQEYETKTGLCPVNGEQKAVDYEELNKVYNELYGTNSPKQGFALMGFYNKLYDYNEEKNIYNTLSCTSCGGRGYIPLEIFKIRSINEENGTLEITIAYDYAELETKELTEIEGVMYHIGTLKFLQGEKTDEEYIKDIEENHLDDIENYIVTLEKQDNHYIFKSLTKKIG